MQERDMVNDILSGVNGDITGYANVITQASNLQFRQAIQQIRDSSETFQYDLYKIAEQKGYYMPAQQANMNEVQQIKTKFQS